MDCATAWQAFRSCLGVLTKYRLAATHRSIDDGLVELCDLNDLPLNEAARKLTLSLPAVKGRHRARQKLLGVVPK